MAEVMRSGMSLLRRISTCADLIIRAIRAAPWQLRSISQIQSGANRAGWHSMASSSRACSDSALSVPAGPCGIANSARHEQQVSGSARRHGYGPESSAVPTVPKNCLLYTSDAADDLLCVDLG